MPCTIPLAMSHKRWQIWQTLLLPTNRKSYKSFRLSDLNLTLAYPKGQLGSWKGVFLYCRPTIPHCEQTAGSESSNYCTHMHVDNVRSPASFRPNRQRPWPSFSRSMFQMQYIGKCILHSNLLSYRHGHGWYGRTDDANRDDFKFVLAMSYH